MIVQGSSFTSTFYSAGLVLALERAHYAARVDPSAKVAYLEHRVHRRAKVREVLTVASFDTFDELAARPDLRLVAYSGRISPVERGSPRKTCWRRWIGRTGRVSSMTSPSTSSAQPSRSGLTHPPWECSRRGPLDADCCSAT